jgi:hypothetical protein
MFLTPAQAQDAEDSGFTGTYSDEDEENENSIFGDDEAMDEDEDAYPTHLISLNLNGQVVVTDYETDTAYLEINYSAKLEQEIEIKESRYRTKGTIEFTTEVIGDLSGNELYTCKLDIALDNAEAEIMTRYSIIPETEEEDAFYQLALQVKFKKAPEEDWFSDCLAVDGSVMKTQGDPEKYFHAIWENLTPEMNGILIEDYDIEDAASIDLETEQFYIDDEDLGAEFSISGSGELEVEPL